MVAVGRVDGRPEVAERHSRGRTQARRSPRRAGRRRRRGRRRAQRLDPTRGAAGRDRDQPRDCRRRHRPRDPRPRRCSGRWAVATPQWRDTAGSVASVIPAYRERCETIGHRRRGGATRRGRRAREVTAIDDDGRLVVTDDTTGAVTAWLRRRCHPRPAGGLTDALPGEHPRRRRGGRLQPAPALAAASRARSCSSRSSSVWRSYGWFAAAQRHRPPAGTAVRHLRAGARDPAVVVAALVAVLADDPLRRHQPPGADAQRRAVAGPAATSR